MLLMLLILLFTAALLARLMLVIPIVTAATLLLIRFRIVLLLLILGIAVRILLVHDLMLLKENRPVTLETYQIALRSAEKRARNEIVAKPCRI